MPFITILTFIVATLTMLAGWSAIKERDEEFGVIVMIMSTVVFGIGVITILV